jgi:uncharacterized membrane protein
VTDDPTSNQPDNSAANEILSRLNEAINDVRRIGNAPVDLAGSVHSRVVRPAWQQVTRGETRWAAAAAIGVGIALQFAIPTEFAIHPRWLMPTLIAILLVIMLITSPKELGRRNSQIRALSMVLIAVLSTANIYSGGHLIYTLIHGSNDLKAPELLITGGSIWITNVIVFALWYWEFDRGGPGARAQAIKPYPDFLFAQMEDTELTPPDWEPEFPDYLYLSFTNAAAFSPTDVLPMSRWAKMTMMLQSAVSLALVALVIARAVNILH